MPAWMTSLLRELTPRADPALAFDDDHFAPVPSERSCDGETDDPRADDEALDQFRFLSVPCANAQPVRACPARRRAEEPA